MAEIEYLYPTADSSIGIHNQYPDSGNHYDKVDDPHDDPDEDDTYVYENWNVYYTDLYEIQNTSIPTGSTINSVGVWIRVKVGGRYKCALKTHGNTYYGTEYTPPGGWQPWAHYWSTNPYTGEVWTLDEINDLLVGVSAKRYTGDYGCVTYCLAHISYEPAPAAARAYFL